MLDYKIIGNRIKSARSNKHLTQQEIAEILNVSVPYISKVETGKSSISLKRLSQIADILEVDIGELVSGTNVSSKYYLIDELSSILQDCSSEEKNFAFRMLREIIDINKKKI